MNETNILHKINQYALLILLSLALIAPVMASAVNSSDFNNHYRQALDSSLYHHIKHPLYHVMVRGYKSLFPSNSEQVISFLSIFTFMLPLPSLVFSLLRRSSQRLISDHVLIMLALGLTVMAPITIWTDNHHMIGYLNTLVYHNPTSLALRLFLIPLALVSVNSFKCRSHRSRSHRIGFLLASGSLIVIASLAKPSYTIALIPALGLMALWRVFASRFVNWTLLILGLFIPGLLILGTQYVVVYLNSSNDSGFGLGFLTLFGHWAPLWRIPLQFLLSLVFPVAVYLLFLTDARKHLFLNLSWLVFGVGTLITCFFFEVGPRSTAGNFLWTSYSVVFVLMFASLTFLIEQYVVIQTNTTGHSTAIRSKRSLRLKFAMLIFFIHVLSGVAYYFRTMSVY